MKVPATPAIPYPSSRALTALALAGPAVCTTQEAIAAVAGGRGALLLCDTTAEYHRRPDVTFVPVHGIAESRVGLIRHRDRDDEQVRAFTHTLAEIIGEPAPALHAVM
ncbi:hypothetical protein [Nocardia thraciensis]